MRSLLLTATTASLIFASSAVMAQESVPAQTQVHVQGESQVDERFEPRVYGNVNQGVNAHQKSVLTKAGISDAELERVIDKAARARYSPGGGNVASAKGPYKVQDLGAGEIVQPARVNAPLNYAHRVKQGETLYNISKRYDVKVTDIQSANTLSTNNIAIGQVLVIPSQSKIVAVSSAGMDPVVARIDSQASDLTMKKVVLPVQAETDAIYAVLPKDTLYGISKRSCVELDALATTNGISNPSALKPGQKLVMPEGHCLSR